MRLSLFLLLAIALPTFIFAQNPITGVVLDASSGDPIVEAKVMDKASLKSTLSNEQGQFTLEGLPTGQKIDLLFSKAGEMVPFSKTITLPIGGIDLGNLAAESVSLDNDIATITLDELNSDDSESDTEIYGMLNSGRNLFLDNVRFGVGGRRYRLRGMDSENRIDYLNGMPINKLHDGRTDFYDFGGLNDVLRQQDMEYGLSAGDFSFGGALGSWSMDTRASSQRTQKRISYAISNRSYQNRIMAVYSTGMMPNGFAFTASASHRWGNQGYVDGTYYDNYSYFVSADKKINKRHLINFTFLGSPGKRGRAGVSTEDPKQLLEDNFYNPKWGYQEGKVRNSDVDNNHQPILTFRHDWTIGENTTITSTAGYQFGVSGRTRLNWVNAADPRPDYYHYMPREIDDPVLRERLEEKYRNNPDLLQIDWDQMYQVNYGSFATIENANGIEGNTISGKKAEYIVEESRIDHKENSFNSTIQHAFTDWLGLTGGVTYRNAEFHYFNVVDDLLGADFYYDVDKFNISLANPSSHQPDLNNPNKVAEVGDIIGFDYYAIIQYGGAWAQLTAQTGRFDFFAGGQLSQTSMQREGNMKNGHFPDNSFGKGEKKSFNNYQVKGGVTYKINGRNYLFANGYVGTRAPFFRDSYLSPRTREQIVDGIDSETLTSLEGGYVLNSPYLKARATAYYYTRENRTRTISFFSDLSGIEFQFGTMALKGIDIRNVGTEIVIEGKITPSLTVTGTAGLGQHLITSRPTASFTIDTDDDERQRGTVYWEGYRVANTPQKVYSLKLGYRSKNYWFAYLTGSYSEDTWLDVSPTRKTNAAVDTFDEGEERDSYLIQEELDGAFSLDLFAGKSFKFGKNFLYFNLGVNNILNDTDIRTGGFEQLRVDPERFPNKYFRAYGTTYYLSAAFRF